MLYTQVSTTVYYDTEMDTNELGETILLEYNSGYGKFSYIEPYVKAEFIQPELEHFIKCRNGVDSWVNVYECKNGKYWVLAN